MTTPSNSKISSSKKSMSLIDQEHQQCLDYFAVAERSTNPAIAKLALKLVERREKHQRQQNARLSAANVAILGTTAVVCALAASWYAILHYPQHVASEIISCIVACLLIVIALYGLISGYLTQANFLRLIRMGTDWIKTAKRPHFTSLPLGTRSEEGRPAESSKE